MNTTTNVSQNETMKPGMMPSREKFWSEIKQVEKIERLRNLTKSLLSRMERQDREISQLKELIWSHAHEGTEVIARITRGDRYKLEERLDSPRGQLIRPGNQQTDEVYI